MLRESPELYLNITLLLIFNMCYFEKIDIYIWNKNGIGTGTVQERKN